MSRCLLYGDYLSENSVHSPFIFDKKLTHEQTIQAIGAVMNEVAEVFE